MKIAIFGANGATGRIMAADALKRGHDVVAVTRHPDDFPVRGARLTVVRADVTEGSGVNEAIAGCDAVASLLGASYSRKPISVYSVGTRSIVAAMTETGCRRLVVVSSGLTYPRIPEAEHNFGFIFNSIIHPLLHDVIGRTLYADMRAMEEFLRTRPDIAWTVMRPGRLVDGDTGRPYRSEPGNPSRRYTARRDLAAAIIDSIERGSDIHRAVAITSR